MKALLLYISYPISMAIWNLRLKSPFRRSWIRPVISSYMCKFIDDVFDKLKKACFRSCLNSWWWKVDSDVFFRSQKLILTFSEIWQSGNLNACETNTINLKLNWNYVVFRLYVLMSLIFLCLQGQSQNVSLATVTTQWFMLAMFKAFSKFLKYICFLLASLHF